MRVEQEQKVTEDARRYAEQDAAAQRYATEVLQVKKEIIIMLQNYNANTFGRKQMIFF